MKLVTKDEVQYLINEKQVKEQYGWSLQDYLEYLIDHGIIKKVDD